MNPHDTASMGELSGWFAGRIPADWFAGTPDVRSDRDEILVVGTLSDPELPSDATAEVAASARVARIDGFREDTDPGGDHHHTGDDRRLALPAVDALRLLGEWSRGDLGPDQEGTDDGQHTARERQRPRENGSTRHRRYAPGSGCEVGGRMGAGGASGPPIVLAGGAGMVVRPGAACSLASRRPRIPPTRATTPPPITT